MTAPRVSVVIPAYRAAAFIERTLACVAAQTFKDLEVVVVDDGSPDDTAAVVERFLAGGSLAGTCLTQPNKKIAAARNHGLSRARGEFIAFLDHDDFWVPEKLAVVMAAFERHPDTDLVHHPCRIVDPQGRRLGLTHNGYPGPDIFRSLLFTGNALCPSAVTVRAAKLKEVGGFREDPAYDTTEDYDLWLRLARVARFRFIPEVLGDYLMAGGGASRRVLYHHANIESMLREHFSRLPDPGPWTRLLMRRRLSYVHRAAARALLREGDVPAAGREVFAMLREFPLTPYNLAIAGLWLVSHGALRPLGDRLGRVLKY